MSYTTVKCISATRVEILELRIKSLPNFYVYFKFPLHLPEWGKYTVNNERFFLH